MDLDALHARTTATTATVLMSTYNGARHLASQLASLDGQDYPDVQAIIRDDGSTDETVASAQSWQAKTRMRMHARTGDNLGARDSYFALLDLAPPRGFIFFADQDDIWHPDKISRAVMALGAPEDPIPRLYCSRLNLVDDTLSRIGQSPLWPRPPSFANALVENIATGCTVALNQSAVMTLRSRPWPDRAIMHDWWAYLVVSAFGEVVYDPKPTIDYRLHPGNAVGLPSDKVDWFLAKIRRQLATRTSRQLIAQAGEFERLFGNQLTTRQRRSISLLQATDTFRGGLRFTTQSGIRRQFASDTLFLKLLMLARASGVLR